MNAETKQTKFSVSRDLIESLAKLQSITDKNAHNSYSRLIRVELSDSFNGSRLVATTNYALCQHAILETNADAFRSLGFKESFSLEFSDDALKNLLKDKKNTLFYVELYPGTKNICFSSPFLQIIAIHNDYYPNYKAVLPDPKNATTSFTLDFDILESLVKSLQNDGKPKGKTPITFNFISEKSPIVVRAGLSDQVFEKPVNVIMPMSK